MIAEALKQEILKKFKKESKIIFKQMYSLRDSPQKGKLIGKAGGILIKELKYKNFRFYFLTNNNKIRIMDKLMLSDMLIKFVRMSDKKNQQKVINEIKEILSKLKQDAF